MKGEVWPDRNIMHKWMGPADSCDECYGRGWIIEVIPGPLDVPDTIEKYCACPCGRERKRIEQDDEP